MNELHETTPLTWAQNWTEFDPRSYLDEYYADIGAENYALLQFFAETYQDVPADSVLLDFGGGPTIYSLISAAPKVKDIHMCDYLDANLAEVRQWLRGEPSAFDWRPFVNTALQLEYGRPCSEAEATQREAEIRSRVTYITTCDLHRSPPLSGASCRYDIVTTNFCAESVTDKRRRWYVFLQRIVSLIAPGGKLVLSTLKGATSYSVGARAFPAVNIAEHDLRAALVAVGCASDSIAIKSVAADRLTRQYRGLMFASARKQREASVAQDSQWDTLEL